LKSSPAQEKREVLVEPSLTIGEVATQVGLRASALRYYEEAGLLPPPERLGGKRRYSPEVVELLLLIRFCQRVGFSLAEVRELLASPAGRRAKERWRALVDAKLTEVDALIEQALQMKRVLEESRDCDCVTLESCSFIQDERAELSVAEIGRRRYDRSPGARPGRPQ
jgi:MerR family transcriptional regulator, redox-sensitive transcriptional activator SoxR